MSRSDSRQAPPGGYRPQAAPPQAAHNPSAHLQGEYDLAGWTQGLGGAPLPNPKPQHAAAPQGFPQQQQPVYGSQPAAPQGYGYGQPDPGAYWGTDQQSPAAPQFDPYTPPTTPSRRPAQPVTQPAAPYAQPQAPAGYGNGNGYVQPEPALRGAQYDQWAAAPQPAADPRGYDLASYMPPQGRTQPPQQDYGHLTADLATHAPTQPQGGYADWGHQTGSYQQAPQGYAGQQPGYDAGGYAQPGYDQQGYADPNAAQQGYEDDGYDYEEPPRGRKWIKVAGALVGAIVLGGGLTFAYQKLLGESGSGPTPVVKSAEGPSKTKPSEPGGKQFANADSKLLGRLGDNGGSSETDSSGARKVQTLVVGRDGAIQAPAAAPPEPVSVPGVSVPVPGMTLIDVPSPGSPTLPPPQRAPQPIVVQPPAEPVQTAASEPRQAPVQPKAINTPIEETAATPPPVAEKPKPAPKPAKVAALSDGAAAAPAPVSKPSGLGYVAVLASVPASGSSRIDALQKFADLQQRYGGILQNKTPDVTEANLGEKGRYHRLVVGPPGSKDGANSVCSQLKTAGYANCWIMQY